MSRWNDVFSEDALKQSAQGAATVADSLAAWNLSPGQRQRLEAFKRGVPLAAILGIDLRRREGLLAYAHALFRAHRFRDANGIFRILYLMQPKDRRAVYGLAATLQMLGDLTTAAQFYFVYTVLDATNADGRLRLSECLMSLREWRDAEGHLRVARRYAASAPQAAYAERLLAHVRDAIARGDDLGGDESRTLSSADDLPVDDLSNDILETAS